MSSSGRGPRVFISSATGALAQYRSAAVDVCHRLGFEPVHMEEFPPERPPPADVCRREVEASDILVLLLAHRYGSRPDGDERSYTEIEYDIACARRLELLAFVVDPDQPWPPRDIDHDDADALDRLVARVATAHTIRTPSRATRMRRRRYGHRSGYRRRRSRHAALEPPGRLRGLPL